MARTAVAKANPARGSVDAPLKTQHAGENPRGKEISLASGQSLCKKGRRKGEIGAAGKEHAWESTGS